MNYYPVYDRETNDFIGLLARKEWINVQAECTNLSFLDDLVRFEIVQIDSSVRLRGYSMPIILIVDLKKYSDITQKYILAYLATKTPKQEESE